jgi:hypothetical protein
MKSESITLADVRKRIAEIDTEIDQIVIGFKQHENYINTPDTKFLDLIAEKSSLRRSANILFDEKL